MASLRTLFDYQKISENSKLAKVIADTESKYGCSAEISDDELLMVAGGALKGQNLLKISCDSRSSCM